MTSLLRSLPYLVLSTYWTVASMNTWVSTNPESCVATRSTSAPALWTGPWTE
ncbi:hypothetical protein ACFQV2_32910 [Actinokineospora soli]|uniref:Uncharacterized protein n=1 Tax=Actinokineospora soli TaxID=1048753 RepID=A0ABW2TUL6_9PSEU